MTENNLLKHKKILIGEDWQDKDETFWKKFMGYL